MSADSSSRLRDSYGQILKSSVLIGGSQSIIIGAGILRAKAMALLLGPAGFGVVGLYTSIVDLAVSAAGLGVASSGIRQIAEATASHDASRIQRTVAALRKTTRGLAIFGALLLAALASMMSGVTFGDGGHTWAIAIVSLAVLFRVLTAGQSALIQGLRRIADLAMMNILGAVAGTLVAIAIVYFLGEDGIAVSVVSTAFFAFLISSWYSQKVGIPTVVLARVELRHETGLLLKLGVAFLVSSLLVMGAAYAVRTMVARELGIDAAGLYSASWTLGGMYVGMLLQAMGADFYPRLTGSSTDNEKCNRLVNEQARVSLLLAAPGVIATLTFAPLLMVLFYSEKFSAASGLLQWLCLGMTLRVISWPMGYIIVAKGDRALFVVTELAWAVVNLGLTWICLREFGLNGAGIAFFGSYVFHAIMIYVIVRRYTGFRFSEENARTIGILLLLLGVVFGSFFVLSRPYAVAFGALCAIGCGLYSLWHVTRLVSTEEMPSALRRLLRVLRLLPGP